MGLRVQQTHTDVLKLTLFNESPTTEVTFVDVIMYPSHQMGQYLKRHLRKQNVVEVPVTANVASFIEATMMHSNREQSTNVLR